MTVRGLAEGPALGDFVDRVRHQRIVVPAVFASLALVFVVVAILAPVIGLLLLASLLMGGVAMVAYSRREVHGHGRLVNTIRHRR